ncbi:DMT family transporter [Gryllotalpicola sp.]|uniref:DMT family transporter n=1 Tax=Gryllotalpicola sp. TaxID=1932787 RepID=UPI002626CD59|nr:DMT family transporter [Gryllotalpicola sp.]
MTRRGLILFAVLSVAWGVPYVFIKIAVGELAPEVVVLGRTALGALLLLPVAVWRRELRLERRHWLPLLAYTVAEIVFPWFFLTSSEERLPSSMTGLLLAAVPLVSVLVALVLRRKERFTASNWAGFGIGLVGVAALVGLDVQGSDLGAVAEVSVAVVGYAIAPVIAARWLGDAPSIGLTTWSLIITAILYVPFVAIRGTWPTTWPSAPALWSIVVLAVVCTAIAFVVLFALIREIGPVRATTVTYLNPAIAIAAGAIVLGEQITLWTVAGFLLVLAGSYLVTHTSLAAPDAPPPTAR